MSKQTNLEKKRLIELMKAVRKRTGIEIPRLLQILQDDLPSNKNKLSDELYNAILFKALKDVLQNNFFGHPERISAYDETLVLLVIKAYRKGTDAYLLCPQDSITLLEAILVISWTHCSLSAYGELVDIFDCSVQEVNKLVSYVIDCITNHMFDSDAEWRNVLPYCEAVLHDADTRPW